MELVEQIGSGIKRMHLLCIDHGTPEPIIKVDDSWFTITFPRVSEDGISLLTEEVTGEVTGHVKRILLVMKGEMKRVEIQEALSIRHEDYFRDAYFVPALEAGYIEMTIPGKPRSSKQKYYLTEKGKKIRESLQS